MVTLGLQYYYMYYALNVNNKYKYGLMYQNIHIQFHSEKTFLINAAF